MPGINGRIGVILTVRDPALSAAWYQSVFGFEVTGQQMDVEGRVQQICLQDGHSGFTLCLLSHGPYTLHDLRARDQFDGVLSEKW